MRNSDENEKEKEKIIGAQISIRKQRIIHCIRRKKELMRCSPKSSFEIETLERSELKIRPRIITKIGMKILCRLGFR